MTIERKPKAAVRKAPWASRSGRNFLSVILRRMTLAGTADVDTLAEWGRAHAGEGTPRREEREALLRKWAES